MKNSLFRYVCLVVALLICSFADAQQKANYKLAEKFRLLEQNPIIKYSTEVKPTFINGTDCFYYSFTTREGKKYYYVNPKKKEKRLLFDTAELLSKIAVYTKKAYSLHFTGIDISNQQFILGDMFIACQFGFISFQCRIWSRQRID